MSHKATNWFSEIDPGLMTSGEFRVLFFLADCHNPSRGCFPEQAFLRAKTGLSNGGLNKCLASLEDKRLISRKQRYDAVKKKRKSTLYVLGCDADLNVDQSPQSGGCPNSTSHADQTPLSSQSKLHPSGDKPVKEPVKEPCARNRVEANFLKSIIDGNASIANRCPLDLAQAFLAEKQITPEQCRAVGLPV